MIEEDFTCMEWLNYADRCKEQCNMCKDSKVAKWIDIEDGQGNNEIN